MGMILKIPVGDEHVLFARWLFGNLDMGIGSGPGLKYVEQWSNATSHIYEIDGPANLLSYAKLKWG
jgi:hypothetical protein